MYKFYDDTECKEYEGKTFAEMRREAKERVKIKTLLMKYGINAWGITDTIKLKKMLKEIENG
jgi:hypothetical protein